MKRLMSLVCVLCLVAVLAGCGDKGGKSYNITDVLASLSEANAVPEGRDITADDLQLSMNLQEEDYEEFAGTVSNDQYSGALNLVLKAKAGKADTLKTALETYRDNMVTFLGSYPESAAQVDVVKEGRVVVHGDYVVVAFGASSDVYTALDTAIDEAFK